MFQDLCGNSTVAPYRGVTTDTQRFFHARAGMTQAGHF